MRVSNNVNGEPDSVLTDDELHNFQYFIFSQLDISLNHGWYIAGGLSINQSKVDFSRLSGNSEQRSFGSVIAPRIAVSKELNDHLSLYGTISKGFSPLSLGNNRLRTETAGLLVCAVANLEYLKATYQP